MTRPQSGFSCCIAFILSGSEYTAKIKQTRVFVFDNDNWLLALVSTCEYETVSFHTFKTTFLSFRQYILHRRNIVITAKMRYLSLCFSVNKYILQLIQNFFVLNQKCLVVLIAHLCFDSEEKHLFSLQLVTVIVRWWNCCSLWRSQTAKVTTRLVSLSSRRSLFYVFCVVNIGLAFSLFLKKDITSHQSTVKNVV